jgi:NAD(P)-dependent dehydrogenase (short-subunit alcohol dehydrogenase family)
LSTGDFKGIAIAVRDTEYGAQVKQELLEAFTGQTVADIAIIRCDLSDNKSVVQCAGNIQSWLDGLPAAAATEEENKNAVAVGGLNLLINNAGIMFQENSKAADGTDNTWSTNVRGPVLLTELLLPALQKATGGARIVNVASGRHYASEGVRYDRIRVNTEDYDNSFADSQYNDTKLANVLHANALAAKLGPLSDTNNVTANSCEPGFVATTLFRTNAVANFMSSIVGRSPEDGAKTQLTVALDASLQNTTGAYFKDCVLTPCNPVVTPEASQKLYEEVLKDVQQFL